MEWSPATRAIIVAASFVLAGTAGAETRITIGDAFEAGRNRFWSNSLSLAVEPSDRLAFDLMLGASHSGTRTTDTSGGLGASVGLGDAVTASLRVDRFNGAKGYLIEDRDPLRGIFFEVTGEGEGRQRTTTWDGSLRWRVFGAGEEEEAEREDRVFRAFDLQGGVAVGRLAIPSLLRTFTATVTGGPTRVDERELSISQRQWDASVGVYATVTASEIGVSYRRSHFGELAIPPEFGSRLPPLALNRLLEEIRGAVSWVLSEPVLYATTASLYEPLPAELALYVAHAYSRLLVSRGIARTTTAELSWRAGEALALRLGGLAVREAGATSWYGTAGASYTF